jgi:hypothetical protein
MVYQLSARRERLFSWLPLPGMAVRSARARRDAGLFLSCCALSNTDTPVLWPLFEIVPDQRAVIFEVQLIVERLGIVIVDQDKLIPWSERCKPSKDETVALGWREGTDI